MDLGVFQAPLSMGFSRQQYWSELPFLSLVNLPRPRIKPVSPALAGIFFTAKSPGKWLILTGNVLFSFLPVTHPSDLPSFLIGCSSSFWLCLLNSLTSKFSATGPLPSSAFSSIQFSSVTQSRPTLCNHMNHSTWGLPVHHQLPQFIHTQVHRVGDATEPSYPLSSPSPPASNPPSIRVFSNQSTLRMKWPKYWSFSFSISLSNEHPGRVSFRMDWLDLLVVQRTHRVFSNTTVQKDQFFSAQPSSQSNSHIHTWP